MAVLLGGLVFGLIIIGFTALMFIPALFVLLGLAVFREPWSGALLMKTPEGEIIPSPEIERPEPPRRVKAEPPRVMVAGRRQPLR